MNNDNSVLLIVDIQKRYVCNFNIDYLSKVNDFLSLGQFNEIQCLVDCFIEEKDGEFIPTFIYNKLTHKVIFKQYSQNFPLDRLHNRWKLITPVVLKFVKKTKPTPFFLKIGTGAFFNLGDKQHEYQEYITNCFLITLNRWKAEGKTVHLIGGGLNRCVRVTASILDSYGIPYVIESQYCYDIGDTKFNSIFEGQLKSSDKYSADICYTGSDRETSVKWTYVQNLDEEIKEYIEKEVT